MNRLSSARVKSVALTTAKVLGAILGGLALLVGLVLTLLQTDWGGERLRRTLVKRVNAEIRGQLDVGRLTFRTNGIGLSGVRLSDPSGRPIALIGTVRVQFRPTALLRKELHVTDVLLDRPALNLVSDDGELNLAQALGGAPSQAAPAAATQTAHHRRRPGRYSRPLPASRRLGSYDHRA